MNGQRGTMVVSLDLELCWGRFDKVPVPMLEADASEERIQIRRLLALLDRYEIPATWAIVGHLMLAGCSRHDGAVHMDVTPRPDYSWFPKDWYVHDPCTSAIQSPGWYAPDILEWIRATRVRHEIASHSFGHIYYGDPECSASAARADLTAAVEAAAKQDVTLKSFVFPRNQVGHLDVLREQGICAYRGTDPTRFRKSKGVLYKTLSFLDQLLGVAPKSVRAEEVMPGLWNIPGNHFYMARNGLRKMIPMASRVWKGKQGIRQAIQTGGVYHLWFHPFNLNADADAMLSGLEQLFAYARRLREQGVLDIFTMDDYRARLTACASETVGTASSGVLA
ncbi:MAG: polysaccharide deacetylase family protein [Nitrospira sp.]|jgi:peptidoglycan/xylan/chitin deacetylase (PgdA/CDA1 family)|nr:polysaccharide deacetylase family protein [Nitrospira sp.]MBP6606881.1 polysaccharide deacetylase family protein [Nitrospira sp.]